MTTKDFEKHIKKMIKTGEYLYGEKLPGERALALEYGLNRMAIKNAIGQLVTEGLLYRVQGRGTFVRYQEYDKLDLGYLNEAGNSGITAMVKSKGVKIANKVLLKGIINGNSFYADRLRISKDDPVFVLHRIRYGNEEPIGVEYTYLKAKYFPDIENVDFEQISLYDYMDSMGHLPIIFDQTFRVMEATEKDSRHLGIKPRVPVYYFEFVGMDDGGEVVEYTESVMRTDKSEFRFTAKSR